MYLIIEPFYDRVKVLGVPSDSVENTYMSMIMESNIYNQIDKVIKLINEKKPEKVVIAKTPFRISFSNVFEDVIKKENFTIAENGDVKYMEESADNKYSTSDVFDLHVYYKDNLLFKIDTVREMKLYKEIYDGTTLVVKDALLDIDVFNDIFADMYKGKELHIIGKTSLKNVNDEKHSIRLVCNAWLTDYSVSFDSMKLNDKNAVKLTFSVGKARVERVKGGGIK